MPQPRPHRSVPGRGAPVVRWRARTVSFALAVTLLAVLGALFTGVPAASASGSCSGPLASGQIRVVMVVDPGETGPEGPQATCLVVAAGTSGSKILAQRAAELGLPSPRYAGSGLLCGLDGFPATSCPVNNGGSYAYWAYFNGGSGGWSFGHDNPFVRRMVDGEIMGWRYTTGSTDGDAPQPRIAPSASLFPPLTPATTAPAPAPPPPSGGSSSGSAGGAIAGGGAAPSSSATPSGPSTPTDPGSTVDAAVSSTTAPADSAATSADGSGGTEELAAAPASSSGSGAGRWVGLIVAVAAVGALAFGAVTRSRARARSRS